MGSVMVALTNSWWIYKLYKFVKFVMITSNYLQKLGSLLQYKCFYGGTKYYQVFGFNFTGPTAANSHVSENKLLSHAKRYL